MAQLFQFNTCFEAWHSIATNLLNNREGSNFLIEIDSPCEYNDLDEWIVKYDPAAVSQNAKHRLNNIINTIFPYKLSMRVNNRNELYNTYLAIYNRSRRLRNQKWGTYFERLINYPNSNRVGEGNNQLENAIRALNSNSNCRNYITFHLTSANIESNARPMGAPCWQFGELVKNGNRIDLIAVYRNHDYFYKAFGNFIGLSRLLQYICMQSNKEPGKLIIHSTHAYYNSSKKDLRQLLSGGII